ncbi:MAG: EAL domain-containing protein [Xanthobacteraceae bacterium]|nr:EAL domain-containing protein [Xanthobacteraceae bacterium]
MKARSAERAMNARHSGMSRHDDISTEGQKLRASSDAEARLDAALNGMQQGLCMFDAQGRIVMFNQRYIDLMKLPASDLVGMSLLDLFHRRKAAGRNAGDPERMFADLIEAARAGRVLVHKVQSLDGKAQLRVTNQPMANGGWVATIEDISELKAVESEVERRRDFLDQVLDNVPVAVVVKEPVERRFVHVNRAAEEFWGISRGDAIGKTLGELFPNAPTESVDKRDADVVASGHSIVREAHPTFLDPNGNRMVTSKRHLVRDAAGKPLYLIGIVEDVTGRVRLEQERDRDRQFLNQIIENVPTTIVVRDANTGRYVLANQAAINHFGIPRAQIVGKRPHEIFSKEAADVIEQHDADLLRSGGSMFFDDYPIVTPGKRQRFINVRKLVIRDGAQKTQFIVSVIEDVTDRKTSEARIAHMAHYDALTDLPNRIYFREQLEQALKRVKRGEKLAVLFLDLDKFKGVNDTLGHQGGDELLKTVAERLKACVRETDIVARLGGDEFAIVQTNIEDATSVTGLAERIHSALRQPCELEGNRFSMDASIGISMAPVDGTEADQLLQNADLAMYGAKADGRATYRFFEAEMDAEMRARRALEFDLRQAIMCGELEMFYQPLVNIRDKSVVACEALLRWRHPVRGFVSPAEFIPVAEDAGLVNQLGEFALRTACIEAAAWRDDILVTVNVSPVQFKNDGLVPLVVSALAESGLPARRLELEITESVLLHDDELTLRILGQLRELGVRIAMDDFGTGYSSLNYLRRFPFDKVKIDRSFIEHIADDPSSLAIVQAVIGIAKSRDITTTAEGVEKPQQLELLRALGCTEMQGFLFSPPKPAAELAPMLQPRPAEQPQRRSVA